MNTQKKMEEPLPLDLQLDLLVDEELPETERKALLRSLDARPETWRELSIRFLQRQVERRSSQQLIEGGALVVHDAVPPVYRFPGALRTLLTRGRLSAIAASLIIAAGSAGLTWYALRNQSTVTPTEMAVTTVNLPGNAFGMEKPMAVEVPVVSRHESTGNSLFMQSAGEDPAAPSRRSLVIQPDGNGNAIVVPVNTLTNVSWR